MKSLTYIFSLLYMLLCTYARAQCPVNAGMTTYPDPAKYNVPHDPSKIKMFNWMANKYDIYINYNQQIIAKQLDSPFNDIVGNPNVRHFNDPVYKDFRPEDGWEFIAKQFGIPTQGTDNPLLILYNRYTGTLRVFVNITQIPNGLISKGGLVGIEYLGNIATAALNHLGSYTNGMDLFDRRALKKTPNSYLNGSESFWLYADFPTIYDPCTCKIDAKFNITVALFQQYELKWKTTGTNTLTQPVATSTPNGQLINNTDFFTTVSSITDIVSGIAEKGTKGFEKGTKLKQDIIKLANNSSGILGKQTTPVTQSLGRLLYEVPVVNQYLSIAQSVISVVKKISGAEEPEKAISSVSITQSQIQLETNGTMASENPFVDKLFAVPGTSGALNVADHEKPVYNNILGVFNLFEMPELEYAELYNNHTWVSNNNCEDVQMGSMGSRLRHYHVTKGFKYLVNPASRLKVKKLEAAFVITTDLASMSDTLAASFNIDRFGSCHYGEMSLGAPVGTKTKEERLNADGYILEYVEPHKKAVMRTYYVNPDCLKNFSLLFTKTSLPKIECRVKIVYEIDPLYKDPSSNVSEILQIYTYPVKVAPATFASPPGWEPGMAPSVYYESRSYVSCNKDAVLKYFYVSNFSSQPSWPFVNVTYNGQINANGGTNKSVFSYGILNIKNRTFNSNIGYTTSVKATELVEIEPNSVLEPSTIVEIGYNNACSVSAYPIADPTSYCNGGILNGKTYKQRAGVNKTELEEIPWEKVDEILNPVNSIAAVPNPLDAGTKIQYSISTANHVRIIVTDLTGRFIEELVNTQLEAGSYSVDFNASELPSGVYLYNISSGEYFETKKMVIVR